MEILKELSEKISKETGLSCSAWAIPRDGGKLRKAPYIVLEKEDGGVDYADNGPLMVTTEIKAMLVISTDDSETEEIFDGFLWENGFNFSYTMGYDSSMQVIGKQYSFTVISVPEKGGRNGG